MSVFIFENRFLFVGIQLALIVNSGCFWCGNEECVLVVKLVVREGIEFVRRSVCACPPGIFIVTSFFYDFLFLIKIRMRILAENANATSAAVFSIRCFSFSKVS